MDLSLKSHRIGFRWSYFLRPFCTLFMIFSGFKSFDIYTSFVGFKVFESWYKDLAFSSILWRQMMFEVDDLVIQMLVCGFAL